VPEDEAPEELAGQQVISFATVPDCEAWFAKHHADHRGFWLKIGKVGAAETVTYVEALEVALCYGWIDGQKRGYDETYWLQRFTPRGPRSKWSQINRDKTEALIEAGRMRTPGQAQVDAATADGRWAAAYAGQKSATVPADLAAALAADPEAKAFFETLNAANRYAILYRVQDAKRPETRAARIAKFVDMCHNHETVH
jgi:uncharacterized protein YdeI (YjbR/CyaY-like superfamily)